MLDPGRYQEQSWLELWAASLRDGQLDGCVVPGVRCPDFLGVGTQKGGTTYLHNLLKCHPQIFLAHPKEIHFFSLHWQKGKDWYFSHFNDATDNQVCGEFTPYYLYHPEAPQRICSLLPEVKNIILLRDPVKELIAIFP